MQGFKRQLRYKKCNTHPPRIRDVAIAIVRGTTTYPYLCLCSVTRTPTFQSTTDVRPRYRTGGDRRPWQQHCNRL